MRKATALSVVALVTIGLAVAQESQQRQPVEVRTSTPQQPSVPPIVRPVEVVNFPNPQNVAGAVEVTNLPETQHVAGTVNVGNLPAVQEIVGSVAVSNHPAVQSVTGTVIVGNLPLDAAGEVVVAPPAVVSLVVDLLDGEVTVPVGESWLSDTVEVAGFTRVGMKTDGGAIGCVTHWQWDTDDGFFQGHPSPSPGVGNPHFGPILGLRLKAQCFPIGSGGGGGTLRDVKILLRRE